MSAEPPIWGTAGSSPEQPASTLTTGSQLGPYRIEGPIGKGGMGEVFLARDTRLGRTVAIKLLPRDWTSDPNRRRRLLEEARAASSLNHPNIVVLYDVGAEVFNGVTVEYIIMEYVRGKTLKDLIPPGGLALDRVAQYASQLASALGAAHTAGMVHRDIKPANIMVTSDEQVKVLDFGLAKRTVALLEKETQTVVVDTTPGMIMGTVVYMSPEQTRGERLDARSDIFSLGSVLYEAATGVRPFEGASLLSTMQKIAEVQPVAPSRLRAQLPQAFDQFIAKCVAKDPAQRFQTMAEVAAGIRQAFTDQRPVAAEVHDAKPLIAILPFSNVGADRDNEYFGDGLAEELINALTTVKDFRVISRSATFAFRGQAIDAREVGRKLNATAVLEGSIRRSQNRLRVTSQLVNVADGCALWSARYDREMADVFEIQDEISGKITAALVPALLGRPATSHPRSSKRHTEDPEAYSLYLKGRYYWYKRPGEAVQRAIEYFKQAVERDPKYALAYAGLADVYNTLGGWEAGVLSPGDAFSMSRPWAERALALDPDLAEGHSALGYALLHFAWDLPEAERLFKKAISLDPHYGSAHHWYSHVLAATARLDESLAESLAYLNTEPADQVAMAHLIWHYIMAHDFDRAQKECARAFQDEPNFSWHHTFNGWALLAAGHSSEACLEMERAVELAGGPNVMLSFLAHAYARSGRRDDAMRMLGQLSAKSRQQYVSPYEIGLIHEALGDKAEALRWWEQAYSERSPWLVYLARDPRVSHLRGDPEFESLLARVGRRLYKAAPDSR